MNRTLGLYAISAVAGMLVVGAAQAMPASQITARVNDNIRTTLVGNTIPYATAANDRGVVSDKLAIPHAQILLHRTAAQEKELGKLIVDLHNPKSSSYHKWLTAREFGNRFGASDSDISKITAWLSSHGLKINSVSTGRTIIDFSGNAGQIRETFHTPIHNLTLNGEHYIGNMVDPQVPSALAPAMIGVVSLNTFRPHTNFVPRHNPKLTSGCFNGEYPCLGVVPADFATIYNLNPLFKKGITGKGQTVVVVEDTLIGDGATQTLGDADWKTFRKTFGLSGYTHASFTQGIATPATGTTSCENPGITPDEGEATLDAEWASASAPDARIRMVGCKDTMTFGPLIAIEMLVNSSAPPAIVSQSYGQCETFVGNAGNATFNATYQQGVAEGMTILVSSGDESATSCDADQSLARHGIGISGFASTPYDLSVGGTDFGDVAAECTIGQTKTAKKLAKCDSKYWNATNTATFGSAKSYIPEIPWNTSCASVLWATFASGSPITYGKDGYCNSANAAAEDTITTASGSGGPSGCVTGSPGKFNVVGGTCQGYAKPAWQAGMFGNPADGVRDIPDVSLFAANGLWHHFYMFCDSNGGGCQAGHPENWDAAGGTSFSSPIFAGIMALIEQNTGERQGLANTVLYSLASAEFGTKGNAKCNSSLGTKEASSCVFHDVTTGDFDVPCVGQNSCYDPSGEFGVSSLSSTAYKPAYKAHPGWDFTTGLGTVDATNLVNAWPK
jgi:subtilase family serine protease